MSFAKGQVLPVHNVRCRDCGAAIQRKSYWRNPSCRKCSKKRARVGRLDYDKRVRQEARRYRILLSVGPYKTWQELLHAIRIRNPRGWATNFALAIERRSA